MRILHVIEAMHTGGAESLLVEHARHAGDGVEVLVAALNRGGPALDAAAAAGARTFVLGGRGAPAARVRQLAELVRRERVSLVNGHNPSGALYATPAARLCGVPAFRTEHSLHYPGRHSSTYGFIEPLLSVLTRRVVCVCQAVLQSHVSRLPWAARRFVTVANGISPAPHTRPRESLRRELNLPADAHLVLNVGSLTWQKAQGTLLEALASPSNERVHLAIAGEGPLRGELEARARVLGLEPRLHLLGARTDVADLMTAADVFALSSVREGLSVTLLESMRAGLPAVVTDVGGNAEAVADGVSGVVVPREDPAALGQALVTLSGDAPRRLAMGAEAHARWRSRFTGERMVRETEALYREALGRVVVSSAWDAPAKERHAAS